MSRERIGLLAVVCLVSACKKGPLVIGVSWASLEPTRFSEWDEPALRAAIEDAGATYVSADAQFDPEKQADDIASLVEDGANALIVLAIDSEAIGDPVRSALDQGVPVAAYDRLIDDADVLLVTFDNVEVGRMQAHAVFEEAPTGNYVFIMGDPGDPNSDLLRIGQDEVLQAAIDAGDIVVVGDTYTDFWSPEAAEEAMAGFLSANSNDVDAVVCENDGMAMGAIAALDAEGLAGVVPISGQDGDHDALNRVAKGLQTVSVWKDARDLGRVAGEAAIALASGTALEDIDGAEPFETPSESTVQAVLLTPVPITQENLDVVVEAGWIDQETLCAGVTAGAVTACP